MAPENENPRPRERDRGLSQRCRRRPTLPRPLGRSTIGAAGLNGRVRDGNGCGPCALVTSDFDFEKAENGKCGRSCDCESFLNQLRALRDYSNWFPKKPTGSSQAARAIRTASLGACCHASTGGLST